MSVYAENIVAAYYGDIEILRNVSVQAEKGKITAVIGPNGAGKSTLLKIIYGFLRPRSGRVIFDGEDITRTASHLLPTKGLGLIPQRHTVFPYLSVDENLKLGAWSLFKDKKTVEKAISEIYERFPLLEKRGEQPAGKLSGGEQRMLEFARALMISPKALLVDEPTAGLSPKVAKQVYDKLTELRKMGIGMLVVDQNVKSALHISDFVYVMKMGEIAASGPIEKFQGELSHLVKDWLF